MFETCNRKCYPAIQNYASCVAHQQMHLLHDLYCRACRYTWTSGKYAMQELNHRLPGLQMAVDSLVSFLYSLVTLSVQEIGAKLAAFAFFAYDSAWAVLVYVWTSPAIRRVTLQVERAFYEVYDAIYRWLTNIASMEFSDLYRKLNDVFFYVNERVREMWLFIFDIQYRTHANNVIHEVNTCFANVLAGDFDAIVEQTRRNVGALLSLSVYVVRSILAAAYDTVHFALTGRPRYDTVFKRFPLAINRYHFDPYWLVRWLAGQEGVDLHLLIVWLALICIALELTRRYQYKFSWGVHFRARAEGKSDMFRRCFCLS